MAARAVSQFGPHLYGVDCVESGDAVPWGERPDENSDSPQRLVFRRDE